MIAQVSNNLSADWLLRTKLGVPAIRPELVPRPDLLRRLHEGLEAGSRLTFISAPAGTGKTTLLVNWIQELARPACWLTLDEGDNDLVRFLNHLSAGLGQIDDSIGRSLRAYLPSPKLPPSKLLVTALLNEVEAAEIPFVVVLDDYQLIEEPAVHAALSFFLDHQPENVHLALSTRSDPPLPLARLRGRGQITEFRADDLRFRQDEADLFLNQIMELDLRSEDVARLVRRTEGWAVGLQLSAVSLRAHPDRSEFIRNLAGDDRFVMDYLMDEVLANQSHEVRAFLLRTAIVKRLTAPLCDALMGNGTIVPGSQHILEYLERSNLFILSLDNRRQWYRYHQLFAQMLRNRLQTEAPEQVPHLHQKASQWFEDNGFNRQAIDHALAAGKFHKAADLIERHAESIFMSGEFDTYLDWLEELPQDEVQSRPRLRVYQSLVMLLTIRPIEKVKASLSSVKENYGDAQGELYAVRAIVAMLKGDHRDAVTWLNRAREQISTDSYFMRGLVARTEGALHRMSGDVRAAGHSLREAELLAEKVDDLTGRVVTIYQSADLEVVRGRLGKAEDLYQKAIDLVTDEKGRTKTIACRFLAGLGDVRRERNELDVAQETLFEAIRLAAQSLEIWGLGAHLSLARVHQALGDNDGALRAIDEALRLAKRFDASEMDDALVMAHRAMLLLQQGATAAVSKWAKEKNLYALLDPALQRGGSDATEYYSLWELELLVFVQLLLTQKRPGDAMSVLELLLQPARDLDRGGSLIEILILISLANDLLGNSTESSRALSEALSLAAPQRYVRVFLDKGRSMGILLKHRAIQDVNPSYVRALLVAFDKPAGASIRKPISPTGPSSTLSAREMEVLRLLDTHLNSTEIANELCISVNTARFHIKNIYAKVGAHSRSEAVAIAKEQALL